MYHYFKKFLNKKEKPKLKLLIEELKPSLGQPFQNTKTFYL